MDFKFKKGDVLIHTNDGFKVVVHDMYESSTGKLGYILALEKSFGGLPKGYKYKVLKDNAESRFKLRPIRSHHPVWW